MGVLKCRFHSRPFYIIYHWSSLRQLYCLDYEYRQGYLYQSTSYFHIPFCNDCLHHNEYFAIRIILLVSCNQSGGNGIVCLEIILTCRSDFPLECIRFDVLNMSCLMVKLLHCKQDSCNLNQNFKVAHYSRHTSEKNLHMTYKMLQYLPFHFLCKIIF